MGQQFGQQLLRPKCAPSCYVITEVCDPDRFETPYEERVRIDIASEFHQKFFKESGLSVETKFREERPLVGIDRGSYKGQWSGTHRDGYGVQHYESGAKYHGEWSKDKRHGMGSFDHATGDVYCGEWEKGLAHGDGIFASTDGSRYDGQWFQNRQHGTGKETWADGATFEGVYDDGYKVGPGFFHWSDGSTYEGQMSRNQFSGEGKFSCYNGRRYEGQWLSSKMNGQGCFTWEDGKSYDGEYKDDKKHGAGKFTFSDGRQYEGEWRRGKMHGAGTWRVPAEGKEREGKWRAGHFDGWVDDGSDDIDLVRDMEASMSQVSMRRGSDSEKLSIGTRGARGAAVSRKESGDGSPSRGRVSFPDDVSEESSRLSTGSVDSGRHDGEFPPINEDFELGFGMMSAELSTFHHLGVNSPIEIRDRPSSGSAFNYPTYDSGSRPSGVSIGSSSPKGASQYHMYQSELEVPGQNNSGVIHTSDEYVK